jgi:hypothetical protein
MMKYTKKEDEETTEREKKNVHLVDVIPPLLENLSVCI